MNIFKKIKGYLEWAIGKDNGSEYSSSVFFDKFGQEVSSELRIAAAVLLTRAALADEVMTEDELLMIRELVQDEFVLNEVAAKELVAVAFEQDSIDLEHIVTPLKRNYDLDQRVLILELVWRVIYSNSIVSDNELKLAKQIGSLLEIPVERCEEAQNKARG